MKAKSSSLSVVRTSWGASLSMNGYRLDANGHAHDGVVKATVSLHQGDDLVYRDGLTLSSSRSRLRFLMHPKIARAGVDETWLLALDETLRRPRPAAGTTMNEGAAPSGPAPTLADIETKVREYLVVADLDAFRILLAAVLAHRLEGDPCWLMLVGPPSGAKTEVLMLLRVTPGIYPLSELTGRTFASGLKPDGGDDPSLLARLRDETLLFKDFTSVLELHRDERQAILAQLREIYDGRYDKVWGTGKELHWQGRLGFIAGVTPVIDKHHAVMAILGARFLLVRLHQPDRRRVARRAMANSTKGRALREGLARMIAAFLRSRPAGDPSVSPDTLDTLERLADLVTRARSGVERDGFKRDLDYAPEAEMPGRLGRQLFSLLRGLRLLHQGTATFESDDLRRVVRVGVDCIPAVRRLVIGALVRAPIDDEVSTSALAAVVSYSTATVRRALEDLQALGLVAREGGGQGRSALWRLRPEWHADVQEFLGMLGEAVDGFSRDESSSEAPAGDQPADPPDFDPDRPWQ